MNADIMKTSQVHQSAKGNFNFVERLCDLSYPHYNLDLHSYG